jgi:hypothetical protein
MSCLYNFCLFYDAVNSYYFNTPMKTINKPMYAPKCLLKPFAFPPWIQNKNSIISRKETIFPALGSWFSGFNKEKNGRPSTECAQWSQLVLQSARSSRIP